MFLQEELAHLYAHARAAEAAAGIDYRVEPNDHQASESEGQAQVVPFPDLRSPCVYLGAIGRAVAFDSFINMLFITLWLLLIHNLEDLIHNTGAGLLA